MKRTRSAIAMVAGAVLVLTGCAGSSPTQSEESGITTTTAGTQILERSEPQTGGTIRYGLRTAVETLDPSHSAVVGNLIMRSIYGMLFTYDDDRNMVPDMAESIDTNDGGQNWVLRLAPGHTFTDGTPYDAAAVKAHFERLAAEGSRSRAAGDLRKITSMEVSDDLTLNITLDTQWTGFPEILVGAFPGDPAFVPSPTAVEKLGDSFATNPVGAGPFMLETFLPGGDIVVVRNPDFAGDAPYVDRIEFVVATDTQSRISGGIAGDLDLGRTQTVADLRAATDGGLTGLTQPDTTYYNVLFNLSTAPFDDKRFREAVVHAIDPQGVNAAVFEGEHDVMRGYIPPSNPFFAETDFPGYDLDRAKDLIEEYVADTGNPAAFTLTTAPQPENQQQAAIIQQMMADAGVDVTINIADQPTIVTEVRNGTYQAQLRFMEVNDAQNARTLFYTGSGGNQSLAGDLEVDRVLDTMQTATRDEMDELYVELQEALTEWLPLMPLVLQKNGIFVSDRIGGYPGNIASTPDPDFRYIWLRDTE